MHLVKWSAFYLSLLIFSSLLIFNIVNKEYGLNSFLLWLLLILLLLFPPLVKYFQAIKNHKKQPFQLNSFLFKELEILFVAIICILPGLIALQTPEKLFFHGDEAIISRNAEEAVKASLETGKWNFLGHEDGTISRFPALWYVMQGFIINTLGPSVAAVKTFSLLAHLGIVVTQFILISKFFNKYLAWGWVLFYSSMPLVIHFSITGYQNLQSTFFAVLSVALALFAVLTRVKEKRSLLLTLSGIVGGIGMYFYLSSLLIPAYLFIVLIIFSIFSHTKIKSLLKNFVLVFVPFLLISLPFWIVTFNDYNFLAGRFGAFSPLTSISSYQTGFNTIQNQLNKTFLPYVKGSFTGDGEHYINQPALIHPLLAVLSFVGLSIPYIFKKKFTNDKKNIHFCMTLIVITTIFFGSIITVNPPAVQRVLTVFPYLTFFTILGFWFVISPLQKMFSVFSADLFFILLIICMSLIQLDYYFNEYSNSIISANKNNSNLQEFSDSILSLFHYHQNSLLLTKIPVHMNDQIYYYAQGDLSPQQLDAVNVDDFLYNNYSKVYLLIDDLSQNELAEVTIPSIISLANQKQLAAISGIHLYQVH